jgi:hypothetical protein
MSDLIYTLKRSGRLNHTSSRSIEIGAMMPTRAELKRIMLGLLSLILLYFLITMFSNAMFSS